MKAKTIAYIAISTALIAVCSWIMIPSAVPFTMQTFAIFLILELLGGKKAAFAILAYILLGIAGVPVFAGFKGGIGTILGPSGGYIIGFLIMPFVYSLIISRFGKKTRTVIIALFAGLILCYTFGMVWFVIITTKKAGCISFISALMQCVVPFIIPDIMKLLLAVFLTKKLEKHISADR